MRKLKNIKVNGAIVPNDDKWIYNLFDIEAVCPKDIEKELDDAKNAKNDEKNLLEPTTDTVTYSDGTTEEVYGFDVPVPALDEEFDLALIGTKGKWYDHKVSVSNPVKAE